MGTDEVCEIVAKVQAIYPQFKINDEMLVIWMNMFRDMDFDLVMQKLLVHMAKSPFPPAIADIAAFADKGNHFLEKNMSWELEGRERIERDKKCGRRKPQPPWLSIPVTP
ncbi:replicative helicase loader/inhibitor [Mesobacillus foraminis]|uniref:Loader and inhibitor of G40P protein n=1 Tax=Mesobacillus foraminis TaxID=279826 RepID=A0A4R2B1L9_9BACI|nr:replicative helicase loader/inhibitor [Mesobacillus foraminis]TCN20418.1 loader and inhibitor of G40P protein [Mesobacillus foraminis]